MKVGSFIPEQSASTLYAMAGDDCSLHHDLSSLTPKQQVDHQENQVLTCALQVALVGLGKTTDHVALGTPFTDPAWRAMLGHYSEMFAAMGLDSVPDSQWQFHPLDGYYESVAKSLPEVDLTNLYMISGSNEPLHQDPEALAVSRNVNSKLHFAEHAPQAGLPVPRTEVYSKRAIREGEADRMFSELPNGVMVKLLGLAGSRNVFAVDSVADCLNQIVEYDDDVQILLQQKLDISQWREMTVDLTITPQDVSISNVRQILFAGGKWVGNFISSELEVPEAHKAVLMQVGAYARNHGHVAEEGINCGVDYFVSGDEVIVTEINARWTGGLFPAEFLRRLAITERAVAFFDMVPVAQSEAVRTFQSEHLFPVAGEAFAYVPMGFTPFAMEIEGAERYFVWQIVVGDFAAFVEAKRQALPEDAFPTAELILQEALS
jgi:hypothetical protein